MDQTNGQTAQNKIKRTPVHEGPRNHLITFALSLLLTFLAFMAAANQSLSTGFVIFLLVAMAFSQAIMQLAYWMHLKDKGHFYPRLFLTIGGNRRFSLLYRSHLLDVVVSGIRKGLFG